MKKRRKRKMKDKIKLFLRQNWGVAVLLLYIFLGGQCPSQGIAPLARKGTGAAPVMAMAASDEAAGGAVFRNKAMASGKIGGEDRKIAKNLSLSIETKAMETIRGEVEEYVEKNEGFVDNFYSYDYHGKFAYNFSIKIPADRLEAFTKYVKGRGVLKSERFSLTDRTEAYMDNENRLTNLATRRDSLRKLLSTKAAQLSDVIAIERELSNVQHEIERFEKDNRRIQQTVDYSSVSLTILPEIILDSKASGWKLNESLRSAVNSFVKFYQKCVDYSLILLVFSPTIFMIFMFYRVYKIYSDRRNKNE
jgi:hypothetical protein